MTIQKATEDNTVTGVIVNTTFLSIILLLLSGAANASEIDADGSATMVSALKHGGAMTTTGVDHESIIVAKQMNCLRSTKPQMSPTTECTFYDGANGQKLPIYTGADSVFDLTLQHGGTLKEWTENQIAYQRVTDPQIACTKKAGDGQTFLCDVQ